MRLRTFNAKTMPEALQLIKNELGDDAIILSSKEQAGGIQVIAAMDEDRKDGMMAIAKQMPSAKPASPSRNDINAQQLRFDVQECLRFHAIPEFFIAKMLATLNDASTAHILARSRLAIADESHYFLQLALEHICAEYFAYNRNIVHAERIMLVGTPGIGKTLTAAKLATQYAMNHTSPTVITTDITRAGGVDQLKAFTDILGVEILLCENANQLRQELKRANKNTPVIVDTAGCNPYDDAAMAELAALANLAGIEPVLVMAAGLDSQEAIDMAETFLQLPIHRMIATRTDSTRRLGGIVSTAAAHKLALYLNSNSASVTEGLTPFSAAMLAGLLIAPVTKANSGKKAPTKQLVQSSIQTV